MCEVFQKRKTFGQSGFPFTLARREALDYSVERFPRTYEALAHVLVLPLNEKYTIEHCEHVALAVEHAALMLRASDR